MEIILATERAFHFLPQFSVEVAKDRIEQKKANLVSGTLGALLSRPKPDEIQLSSVEKRLEAFWVMDVFLHTSYERKRSYAVPVQGNEIKAVTVLGEKVLVTKDQKGNTNILISGVEHCLEEYRHHYTFNGQGIRKDMGKYQQFDKSEILNLDGFTQEGTVIVPPKVSASTIVRKVLSEIIKPVQAEVILEEQIHIEALELYFRPVYALEYIWTAKNKRTIVEFDALTGEMAGGGEQVASQVKEMLSRDLLFDVTADAVGMLVPGGSIAVKLVKAAIDLGKR
jgi:hypothetical protein